MNPTLAKFMNPTLAKLMIVFILTIIFLILIILGYLFYKSILKPWKIRIFEYQKILLYAQIIIDSQSNPEDIIHNIVKKGYSDIDLIKTAELELKNAKKTIKKEEFNKLNFLKSIKNIVRREKDGKKNKLQQIARGEDKGEIGRKERTYPRSEDRQESRRKKENPRNGLSNAKQRTFQTESVRPNERKSRYFN